MFACLRSGGRNSRLTGVYRTRWAPSTVGVTSFPTVVSVLATIPVALSMPHSVSPLPPSLTSSLVSCHTPTYSHAVSMQVQIGGR